MYFLCEGYSVSFLVESFSLAFKKTFLLQKHQVAVHQYEIEKVKVEQDERRKTLSAETKHHQERSQYQDQLARRRYDDQLVQQVRPVLSCMF